MLGTGSHLCTSRIRCLGQWLTYSVLRLLLAENRSDTKALNFGRV
jgi:hypothetical protein